MRNAPVLLFASPAAKARQVYMPVRGPQTAATGRQKRGGVDSLPLASKPRRGAASLVQIRTTCEFERCDANNARHRARIDVEHEHDGEVPHLNREPTEAP
jgi:hypothetical protein